MNLILGAIGAVLTTLFLVFMAYKSSSIPFWIIVFGTLALMFYDLFVESKENST